MHFSYLADDLLIYSWAFFQTKEYIFIMRAIIMAKCNNRLSFTVSFRSMTQLSKVTTFCVAAIYRLKKSTSPSAFLNPFLSRFPSFPSDFHSISKLDALEKFEKKKKTKRGHDFDSFRLSFRKEKSAKNPVRCRPTFPSEFVHLCARHLTRPSSRETFTFTEGMIHPSTSFFSEKKME